MVRVLQMQYRAVVAHNQIITDAPALSPGCDFFTRSVKGPFVDTGVDIDSYTPNSRIYVSEDTVGEWARMLGWISPEEAERLVLTAHVAEDEYRNLQSEVDRLRSVESSLLKAGFTIPEPEPEEPEEITYPHHKGAGWWILSNGEKIRGNADEARQAEANTANEVAA